MNLVFIPFWMRLCSPFLDEKPITLLVFIAFWMRLCSPYGCCCKGRTRCSYLSEWGYVHLVVPVYEWRLSVRTLLNESRFTLFHRLFLFRSGVHTLLNETMFTTGGPKHHRGMVFIPFGMKVCSPYLCTIPLPVFIPFWMRVGSPLNS